MTKNYEKEIMYYTKRALEKMPIRSSAMGRRMVKEKFPLPETTQDIERYVRGLLNGAHPVP